MTDTKFLSDGRKVAVIGQLNNNEWIVQEIFITESSDEIPSGERFVVRSLHDKPLESYKSREEKKLQSIIEEKKMELTCIQNRINDEQVKLQIKRDILKNSPDLQNLLGEELETFAMVASGTIKYLVIDKGYRGLEIEEFDSAIGMLESTYYNERYKGIKLISLLGNSNGKLSYAIGNYSNGDCDYKIYPSDNYDKALDKFKEIAIEKLEKGERISEKDLKKYKNLKIDFPDHINEIIKNHLISRVDSSIKFYEENIEKNSRELLEEKSNRQKLLELFK